MAVARMDSGCIICLAQKELKNFPADLPEKERLVYMKRVLKLLSNVTEKDSAPVVSSRIVRIQKEMFGEKKDFSKIKYGFNELMLQIEGDIYKKLLESKEPLKRAIQYATVGNYIDFGTLVDVENEKLMELIETAQNNPVDEREYENLKADLQNGKSLVYLTDNCGEVVLDKLLIRIIKMLYPHIDVTIIVRGEQIINDVTIEDARQVGLVDEARIIENGTAIPGTWLEEINEEAKKAMENADVLISKGQGNFETLQGCGMNIYYMFLCKCDLFMERFGVERFASMLINDKQCWKYLKKIEE
ncbi:MAG: damage-control phosphatase ARMT1 family protein [Lachnospiraceae bacterium]